MLPITINDKKVQIPTTWKEITFKQYLKFLNLGETEFINAVALFTGIPKDVWEKSKQIENFYIIVGALEFLQKDPKVIGAKNPGSVKIKGVEYNVPEGLKQYSVKQFEDMRGLIRKEQKKGEITIKLYPKIISTYFCTLIFDDYTIKNLRETEKLINELTIYEVVGIGAFFLESSTRLLTGIQKGRHPLSMIVRKLTQVFMTWMRGVFSIR